jgi:hypothetical protein
MDQWDDASDLLAPKGAEPSGLRSGILCDPHPDGVNHENVRQTGDHRFSPGPQFPGFDSH